MMRNRQPRQDDNAMSPRSAVPLSRRLSRLWTVVLRGDGGAVVIGGAVGDITVVVTVEHAIGDRDGRDVREPVARLVAEVLARVSGGRVRDTELTTADVAELGSPLRKLLRPM